MESRIGHLFFKNLPRKLFALILAFCIWLYIDYSITETKQFPKIPVRVVNLPPERTIRGLMPNGTLEKRLSVTLSGNKDLIDRLERKDFEIVIDAGGKGDEWVVQLDKRNLVSNNPDIDFLHGINAVEHPEYFIKLSKLVTGKVPVYFRVPKGEPPEGYQFLDIFPQRVFHTISGPEEDIRKLVEDGLELSFDLSLISKEDLDSIRPQKNEQNDEVSYPVPESWKRVAIGFLNGMKQELNGPDAKNLRIDFLKKSFLPVERDIPIWVFYPPPSVETNNPINRPLKPCKWIIDKQSVTLVHRPLYVCDVSYLFLDIVRDRIEIVILSDPTKLGQKLRWEVQFIDPKLLEDRYVHALMSASRIAESDPTLPLASPAVAGQKSHLALRERLLRARFREYMQKFQLYVEKGTLFNFNAWLENDAVVVSD